MMRGALPFAALIEGRAERWIVLPAVLNQFAIDRRRVRLKGRSNAFLEGVRGNSRKGKEEKGENGKNKRE